ncbi:MAG: hypothetical protein H6737_14395 [Alphaproteobacteria bacterium]|nr:hypothetical protein [Alphaproteobacteria bacterium]
MLHALLLVASAQTEPLRVRTSEVPPPEIVSFDRDCSGARVANGLALGGLALSGPSLVLASYGFSRGESGYWAPGAIGTVSGATLTTIGAVGVAASGGRCGLTRGERVGAAVGFGATGVSLGFLGYSAGLAFEGVDLAPAFFAVGGLALAGSVVPVVGHQSRLRDIRVVPVARRDHTGLVVTGRF